MVFKSQIRQYLSHLHRINRPQSERPQSVRILSFYFSNLKKFLQFHPLHSFRLPRQIDFLQQSDAHNRLLWFLFCSSIYFVLFQPFQSILQHIMVTMFYKAEHPNLMGGAIIEHASNYGLSHLDTFPASFASQFRKCCPISIPRYKISNIFRQFCRIIEYFYTI